MCFSDKTSFHPASAQLTSSRTSIMTQLVGTVFVLPFTEGTFPLDIYLNATLSERPPLTAQDKTTALSPLNSPPIQCYFLSTIFIYYYLIYMFLLSASFIKCWCILASKTYYYSNIC